MNEKKKRFEDKERMKMNIEGTLQKTFFHRKSILREQVSYLTNVNGNGSCGRALGCVSKESWFESQVGDKPCSLQ